MCNVMKTRLLATIFVISAYQAWAQSTIVYTPGPAFPIPWSLGSSASLDMNQDGIVDLTFSSGAWICTMDVPTSFCSQSFFVGIPGTNTILNQGYFIAGIPLGQWIYNMAPTNTAWSTDGYAYLYTYWSRPREGTSGVEGPIGEQGEGYIGVRFSAADGDHYGWVFVMGQSVMDWAYEIRPYYPIRAGAKPVPVLLTHTSIQRPGYLRVAAETETGKAYQVQVKTSLLDFSWSNLSFALPASSTSTLVDIPMTDQKAFYRVVEAD